MFAIALLGGCSFFLVSGPSPHASHDADCTESRAAPIIDTLATVGFGALAVAGLAAHPNCTDGDCAASNLGAGVANGIGAVALLPTAIYGISALAGYRNTAACRELHARAE